MDELEPCTLCGHERADHAGAAAPAARRYGVCHCGCEGYDATQQGPDTSGNATSEDR